MSLFYTPDDHDPYKGLNDDERLAAGCFQGVLFIVMVFLAFLMCSLFSSCKSHEPTIVERVRTEHHWHADSTKQRDSVHTENTTIIRELDSAAMAKYGIEMKNAERAWLVQNRALESRLRELNHSSTSRDTVHDSIPVPYPVIKKVPAELTWWQQARIHLANIVLWAILLTGLWWAARRRLKH